MSDDETGDAPEATRGNLARGRPAYTHASIEFTGTIRLRVHMPANGPAVVERARNIPSEEGQEGGASEDEDVEDVEDKEDDRAPLLSPVEVLQRGFGSEWIPTARAAEELGVHITTVQTACQSYLRRIHREGLHEVPPTLEPKGKELRCLKIGNGPRNAITLVHQPSLAGYPVNRPDPATGELPNPRGKPAGWKPAKKYQAHKPASEDRRRREYRQKSE